MGIGSASSCKRAGRNLKQTGEIIQFERDLLVSTGGENASFAHDPTDVAKGLTSSPKKQHGNIVATYH